MSIEAWFTLAVTFGAVALMVRGVFPPSAALFGATVVLFVTNVIEPGQALSGFSSTAPFTVAALYVVARATERTGALTWAVSRVMGGGSGFRRSSAKLLVPTAASSAFLNNTPIVAMLVPVVSTWAERQGLSASRYLMPLSFAAVLGGTVTVIGTSTNIVISGLLEESGEAPLGMFELTRLGLPMAVVGIAVMLVLVPFILPLRRSAREDARDEVRDFAVDMVVERGGPLDGAEVEAGGLRHLEGVYLVQIERGEDVLGPVSPATVVRGGDRLRFVGQADRVVDLQNMPGLLSYQAEHIVDFEAQQGGFFEVVLGPVSPLIGQTLKEAEFRGRYQAAVLAIHRAGQRVEAKLGDVRLRVGDMLLVLADPDFRTRWYDRRDFLLISELYVDGYPPRRTPNSVLAWAVVAGIVLAAALGVTTILEASLIGVVLLVGTRVLSPTEARDAVDLDVIITIASAFGLASAISSSGLADELAAGIVGLLDGFGSRGVLLGLVLATIVLTELVTNNAAAMLMYPIAVSAAVAAGLDPRGAAIAVAVAGSASFLTPIGYQTNMMVYGPGGYRFIDYARLGLPLTVTVVAFIVIAVPWFWPA